jgi:uncharacterized protein (TIGR03086 family)
MDPKQHATAALDVLIPVVDGIRPDQLDVSTPCVKWSVRDLLGHLAGGGHFFAAALRGQPPAAGGPADSGDDAQAAVHAAVDDLVAAMRDHDDVSRPVTLPFGEVPAEAALRIAASDLVVHAWDLARATGQSIDPPTDLVVDSDTQIRGFMSPAYRDGDFFADEVAAPAGASPLQRLVAFAGRQP